MPILYLPNVSRQTLRAGGECPPELQPLVELQFRGRVWHQANGRDWTVEAFLTSDDAGLGLDLAQDVRTREALLRSLPLLADAELEGLRGRRLDDTDFDRLAVTDPVRDMLRWIVDPDAFRSGLDPAQWESFRQICKTTFKLDPDTDDPGTAAGRLASGGGAWEEVWRRFRESPRLYRGMTKRVREPAAAPLHLLADESRQAVLNDEAEARLRRELAAVADLPKHEASALVEALEKEHAARREWVWADLGESPFAMVLQPLARLATSVRSTPSGQTLESMAEMYSTDGWRTDQAAIEALAGVVRWKSQERNIVVGAVRALYAPWLDESARRFQDAFARRRDDPRDLVTSPTPEKETCVVFADGLRFDVGALVQAKLQALTYRVRRAHHFAPLPTVTATAKPVATPIPGAFHGSPTSEDFTPVLASSGQPATAVRIRSELVSREVEVIENDEIRSPAGTVSGGWTEVGALDRIGHERGAELAGHVDEEAERIATRVGELLDAGWSRVRVVTDHGWLLLPDGLPKVELPAHLVATRWARCAVVRGASEPETQVYPWHWNSGVRIASPPGSAAFVAGIEYAHGGLSLQECVVPELLVERTAVAVSARIAGVEWRGMRCRVSVTDGDPAMRVDLRRNRRQPNSTLVTQEKELGSSTEISLVVADDKDEGAAATVVLIDAMGNILDHKPTTVGET